MIDSPQFQKNPVLFSLLPVYYMAWADAVLTPEEIVNIKKLIEGQEWISDEERTFLLSKLDPLNPPKPAELKSWLRTIQEVFKHHSNGELKSLTSIGMSLAKLKVANGKLENKGLETSLRELEEALGIITSEVAYHFRSKRPDTQVEKEGTESSFSHETMTKVLDGRHSQLIEEIKSLLSTDQFSYYQGESIREYREQVLQWCQVLADKGYGNIAFPEADGGKNDMDSYFTVMETLSYHDLSMVIKFGVQFGLWGMSVFFLGTEKHHRKYLGDIGTLKIPGCFAMTETGHGSNVKGIETTATYHHDKKAFIIHTPNKDAGKEYIGNAALHGQKATVFAKLIIDEVDYGVNAFVVPLRDNKGNLVSGVTIADCGPKMGLNGVDNGRIWFDHVEIPKDDMLDRFASVSENGTFQSPITSDNRRFFTMLGTLVGGRIGIPRSGLSAMKSGLAIAIQYGDKRKQFGPENGSEVSILNYRTHQRRLMPRLAKSYALHFALRNLTDRFLSRTEADMQEIEALAAGLKAYTTWNVTDTLQVCREACGGKGYLSENRIDRLKNDTDIYTTFEGDNTVLMQLVAKSRLSAFKKEFADVSFFGMVGYIADLAKTNITERNPLVIRNTDKEHLLDSDFHLSAFRFREKHILTTAAKRFKNQLDQGMDSFDAFNQTQYHMLKVGFAYIERIVLEQFLEHIEGVSDENCRNVLMKLAQLYALSEIEENKGWYLEHGYMDGAKTKAIRREVNELCAEIREEAVPLTKAFNIPDECLAAPIVVDTASS